MSAAEMQACLARLYVDAAARRLFALEPESVLREYRLSPEEARALRDVDGAALERFARSLKSKRRRRFVATYPLLFGLGLPAVERYYDRYYHLYPARPGGDFRAEVLEFGRFLEECLAADDEAPPFASDLARYDRLRFAARRAGAGHRAEVSGPEAAPESRSLAPEDRPRLADGVAVGSFRTRILAIVDALEDGQPLPEMGHGPYTFVFRPAPGAADPDVIYVTEAVREVLEGCDGEQTVAGLAAAAEGRRSGGGGPGVVAGALQSLVEHRILVTSPPTAAETMLPPDPEAWLPGGH